MLYPMIIQVHPIICDDVLSFNLHITLEFVFWEQFAISHQFPDHRIVPRSPAGYSKRLPSTHSMGNIANSKIFHNFTLILLTYCTFAYYITICMLRAISQFHINLAKIPHCDMLAVIQHFRNHHISALISSNHTCNVIYTEGSNIHLR